MQSAPKTRATADTLADLRACLTKRFGTTAAAGHLAFRKVLGTFPTGIPVWDAAGGLPQGQLTEACGGAADGALLLESVLAQSTTRISALVDAANALEPADWSIPGLARLLWVRCHTLQQALRATDLLLRDGNCQLLALNLQGASTRNLASISPSIWHRFHRLLESRPSALLVLSPHPLVEGAKMRVACATDWTLDSLDTPRSTLIEKMTLHVFKRGAVPQLVSLGRAGSSAAQTSCLSS